jgi:hypothetical protein
MQQIDDDIFLVGHLRQIGLEAHKDHVIHGSYVAGEAVVGVSGHKRISFSVPSNKRGRPEKSFAAPKKNPPVKVGFSGKDQNNS